MRTLDHWKALLTETPSYIECPEMRLMTGRDFEPPVFVGPGRIEVKNSTTAGFRMFASPQGDSRSLIKVHLAHANPYEMLDQFRLFATILKVRSGQVAGWYPASKKHRRQARW
jgi:hypothetical protein